MQNSKEMRRTNRGHFAWLYKVLCHEKSVKPLGAVQAYLSEECLRFCVDRVALKDWSPILHAIANNRSLSKIYIYSRKQRARIREKINTEEKLEKLWRCGRKNRARPILYTNFLLRCLIDSIAVFARTSSTTITSITLDGIPLAPKYLSILCSGLKNNEKLRNLSLTQCNIGDTGCNLLLNCLSNVPNLRVLNLSACRLTNRSAALLKLFLKRKKADLLQNVWEKSSPRSSDESTTKIQGLRTLILNRNSKFSDNGIRQLAYALKNDLWLKSLCLKHCGITKQGGEIVIRLLQTNSLITRMDLTENHIPINTLRTIFRMLKRKRETAESTTLKKKLVLHWDNPEDKTSKNKICRSSRRNRKYPPVNLSLNTSSRDLLQSHPSKTVQFEESGAEEQTEETESEVQSEQKNDPRRDKLHDLESQLLGIIESNSRLKEQLSSNKALLNVEAQETLRMENELQQLSFRLTDLKNKIVVLNGGCRKTFADDDRSMRDLRYAVERVQAITIAKSVDTQEENV